MNDINIRNIDLNLLRVFQTVYEERNLTRAAEKLGSTQSAVSHALQRLRDHLNDQLFTRASHGMEPTSRARDIAAPIRNALDQIQQTLEQTTVFNPAESRRVFRYGMPDHAATSYLPEIVKAFAEQAPHVSIELYHEPFEILQEMLEDDKLDMATCGIRDFPARYKTRTIIKSPHVVIASKSHPSIKDDLDLERFTNARHLTFLHHGNYIEDILAEYGMRRQVVATVGSKIIVPFIVANSDLIATTSLEMVEPFLDICPLSVFEPPVDLPNIEVQLVWHQRYDKDPAHIWMRELTYKLTKEALG